MADYTSVCRGVAGGCKQGKCGACENCKRCDDPIDPKRRVPDQICSHSSKKRKLVESDDIVVAARLAPNLRQRGDDPIYTEKQLDRVVDEAETEYEARPITVTTHDEGVVFMELVLQILVAWLTEY